MLYTTLLPQSTCRGKIEDFFCKNANRILKKGGILRIFVPDLAHFDDRYLYGDWEADYFLEEMNVLYCKGNRGWKHLPAPYN